MNYDFKLHENKEVYECCQTTIDGINSLIHILSEHNGVCDPDFQNVLKWLDILIKDAEDIKKGIIDADIEALWVEDVSDSCANDCWTYTCSNCMKTFCSKIQRCPHCLARMKNGRNDYAANSAK